MDISIYYCLYRYRWRVISSSSGRTHYIKSSHSVDSHSVVLSIVCFFSSKSYRVHSWLRWNQPHPIIPPRITLARGSNKTKKYLDTYGSRRVHGKKFLSKICLFVYLLTKMQTKNSFFWTRTAFRETYWFLYLHFGQ